MLLQIKTPVLPINTCVFIYGFACFFITPVAAGSGFSINHGLFLQIVRTYYLI